MKWLIFALFFLPLLVIQGQEATPETNPSFCISVWFPSSDHPGGYDSLANNLDVIDIVYPFWYTPLPDGSIQATRDAEDQEKLAAWREAGKIILPSIFSSDFSIIQTEESRQNHIAAIVDLVEQHEYDGIDIDYEGFAAETRENFSLFIEALSEELHTRDMLLSIAVHPKTNDEGTWDGTTAQDWSRLAPAVDIFNIMTYDYTSRNEPPGPVSPTEWTVEVLAYAETVTDLSKVRLGLPFYGYSWMRSRPPATTVSWESINRWVESFDLDVQRTENDMEAFVDLQVRGLPRQMVYFTDSAALNFKLERIITEYPTLGGVAIWGLGGEDPENWVTLHDLRPATCQS